ncbi:N-6 DNA methylase [Paenibacillus sp. P46E]|uniref:N-6 DNA methylase n=1 Tax=Paenibacillus sp. P46E TaxID=1349436 RepID=UPI000939E460|nr:N-6 DNA methylase [Paenibacillus sp. P46E]OKP97052.1 N-6 DNA methylase [Paenibacillus sp. P46E]
MLEIKTRKETGMIYSPIRKKWLVETPEETVRQKYVCRLVNEYGYDIELMGEERKTNFTGRGSGAARADIVIWKNKEEKDKNYNSFIVVECKAENVKIKREDFYQGSQYAGNTRAQFLILHNEKETKYYAVDLEKIPNTDDAFTEILSIPNYEDINDKRKIDEIIKQTKTFTREEFTKLLFKCHNIIRNNDKLSPEAAFDEISKILFIKINHERSVKGQEVFTLNKYLENKNIIEHSNKIRHIENAKPYMQVLFDDTKERYKDDNIFEANDEIKIREVSFEAILKELQKYNLSDTSDDVKGIAFEEFLGKTFRGELGQFFTPRTIVDFMTDILDPQEGEVICDPTCGSGGFLIKCFEHVRTKIENDIQATVNVMRTLVHGENYDELSEEEQGELSKTLKRITDIIDKEYNKRIWELSNDCVYGTDANPRMARVSKMNMIMHGDGHSGVHHHDGLLNVNGIFENRFDVILTNPPFGARVDKELRITEADRFTDQLLINKYTEKYGDSYIEALKQVNENIGKSLIDVYGKLGKMSGLTEVLFIERCLNLLKPGGRMGIVLPEGVLNTSNLQKVREYFEGRAKLILICSIPQDVFIAAGATVKPSVVFLKKFTENEENEFIEAKEKAKNEIKTSYNDELLALSHELKSLVETKKDKPKQRLIKMRVAEIEKLIEEEAKPLLKQFFDYEIPIAKVYDGGITATGSKTDNKELNQLVEEYRDYNKQAKLWEKHESSISYVLKEDLRIIKRMNGKEIEIT